MRSEYNKEHKTFTSIPETTMEALNSLEQFFEADIWYAKGAEWKSEEDMLRYIKGHIDICRQAMIKVEKGFEGLCDRCGGELKLTNPTGVCNHYEMFRKLDEENKGGEIIELYTNKKEESKEKK